MKKCLKSLILVLSFLWRHEGLSQEQKQEQKQDYERFAHSSLYHFDLNGQNTQYLASYLNGQYRAPQDASEFIRRSSLVHLSASYLIQSFKISLQYRWNQEKIFSTTRKTTSDMNTTGLSMSNGLNSMNAYETKRLSQSQKHLISMSFAKNILLLKHDFFYQISLDPSLKMNSTQLSIEMGYSHWLQWKNLWFSLFVHSLAPWRISENGMMMGLSIGRALFGLGWGWTNWHSHQENVFKEILKFNLTDQNQGFIGAVSVPMNAAFHLHASLSLNLYDASSSTIMLAGIRWTGEKEIRESDEHLKNQLKQNPLDPSLPSQPNQPSPNIPSTPNTPNGPKIPDFKRDSQRPLSPI